MGLLYFPQHFKGIREIISACSCEWIHLCLLKARSTSVSETAIEFKFSNETCAVLSYNLKASPPKKFDFRLFCVLFEDTERC